MGRIDEQASGRDTGSMQPRLEDWVSWKRFCARALCSEETQTCLGRFARSRFGIQLQRQLAATNLSAEDAQRQLPSSDDAWHRFESYAALTQTRQGKRYKDWIFARLRQSSRSPLDTIQSGATLIMRGAVRTYLRKELAPRAAVSLDSPVGDGTNTLGDLLPGVAQTETDEAARQHAERLFNELSRRERIGLLAKYSGITLEHPAVLAAADCGKSTLNKTVRDLLTRLRESVVRDYGDEGHNAVMAFTAVMLQHLGQQIFLWKNSEKGLPDCFYRVEERECDR